MDKLTAHREAYKSSFPLHEKADHMVLPSKFVQGITPAVGSIQVNMVNLHANVS